MNNTVFEIVTAKMLESLNEGIAPWSKPWKSAGTSVTIGGKAVDSPVNATNGRPYRGVNVLILGMTMAAAGYRDPRFLTFKQAKNLGGQVKKGERGTAVVFWKWVEKAAAPADETDETGETQVTAKRVPILRYYTVFNVEQCEGLKLETLDVTESEDEFPGIEAADALLGRGKGLPASKVTHGGDKAFYSPIADRIQLPNREAFVNPESYYSTRFHEEVHATGHPTRLNRTGVADFNGFGTETYSREELVAEIGAAFLCGLVGIDSTLDASAAYVKGWAKFLSDKPREIVYAAGQAQKAVDLLAGTDEDEHEDED